ncbi:hypothetical protein QR680_015782 [Steinernema hermaphroditum]|uniref:Hexosyltransferase n=1 Tax=Steinernema hermaphroditum TaxID=289476 RepID=A0AA39H8Y2_9BILA|nr:hypothetical protein QR680_015782 [Steinernema hermaphroditum]
MLVHRVTGALFYCIDVKPKTQFSIFLSLLIFYVLIFVYFTERNDTILAKKLETAYEAYTRIQIVFADVWFDYSLLSKPEPFSCTNKTVIVFVLSAPAAFSKREAIRNTWASKNNTRHAIVRFVVGQNGRDSSEMVLVENAKHGDLIITDINDIKKFRLLKVYSALHFFKTFCTLIPYVLKIDDDTVVALDRLIHFIETDISTSTSGIFCSAQTKLDDRLTAENQLLAHLVPVHCKGAQYLLTAHATHLLVDTIHRKTG